MAKKTATSRTTRRGPPEPIPLPFVADLPDPANPGETRRSWWHIPDDAKHADYAEGWRIGARWAAAYLDWVWTDTLKRGCSLLGMLPHIFAAMPRTDLKALAEGEHGIVLGFLATLDALALRGAEASHGAMTYVSALHAHYDACEREMVAEKRARELKAVARMNAARAAKRGVVARGGA